MAHVRLFVADTGNWTELTDGELPTVRISAPDLAQARRRRAGIKADDAPVSVVLDITVAVAADYRSARRLGVIDADADGVTLIAATPADQELHALGTDVLWRLRLRGQRRAS